MYRKILLPVILLLIIAVSISFAQNKADKKDKHWYLLPSSNLNVELITAKPVWEGTAQGGKIIIEAMFGRPTDIQISITCSDNLKIEKHKFNLDALEARKKKEITFVILPNPEGNSNEDETWVRAFVTYLPDYPAMETLVNDKKLYPDEGKRKDMIKVFEANKKAQKRDSIADVVEFEKTSQEPGKD